MGQSRQGLFHFFRRAGEEVVSAYRAVADDALRYIERDFYESPGEAVGLIESVAGRIAEVPLPCGVFLLPKPVDNRFFLRQIASKCESGTACDIVLKISDEILYGHGLSLRQVL